jgi:hypothetical protein
MSHQTNRIIMGLGLIAALVGLVGCGGGAAQDGMEVPTHFDASTAVAVTNGLAEAAAAAFPGVASIGVSDITTTELPAPTAFGTGEVSNGPADAAAAALPEVASTGVSNITATELLAQTAFGAGGGLGDTSTELPAQTARALGTAPVQATSSSGRIAAALADMSTPNEVIPRGIASTAKWKYGANVTMGTEPYASSIPTWWVPGIRFAEWKAMTAWFVVYPGEQGNPAKNSAVEVDGLEMWVLTGTPRTWKKVQSARVPAWQGAFALNAVSNLGSVAVQSTPSGSRLYTPSNDYMIHGGLDQTAVPWVTGRGADIQAIYVSLRHRLVLCNPAGPDDRSAANIGIAVGVDYYPWVGAKVKDLGATYVPAAGVGRFFKAAADWKYSTVLIKKNTLAVNDLLGMPLPSFNY